MPTTNEATCNKCGKKVKNIPDYLADLKDLWLCKACSTGEVHK